MCVILSTDGHVIIFPEYESQTISGEKPQTYLKLVYFLKF